MGLTWESSIMTFILLCLHIDVVEDPVKSFNLTCIVSTSNVMLEPNPLGLGRSLEGLNLLWWCDRQIIGTEVRLELLKQNEHKCYLVFLLKVFYRSILTNKFD